MNKETTRGFYRLLAILSMALLSSRALAVTGPTIVWSGAADGVTFTNPGNWIGDVVPGAADNAVINAVSGNPTVVFSGTGQVSVESLTTSLPLAISSGTLAVATTLQAVQGITFSGNTGTIKGGIITTSSTASVIVPGFDVGSLNGVTLASALTVEDAGILNVFNGLTLSSGTMTLFSQIYGAEVQFIGTQTLGGTGTIVLSGESFSSDALVVAATTAGGTATLTFGPGITVDCQQDAYIEDHDASDHFINQGTVSVETASSEIYVSGSFVNEGTFSASAGIFDLVGNGWVSTTGTLAVSGSGAMDLGGTFATAGLGTVINTGGALNLTGVLNNTGSTLALNNTTGSFTLDGGEIQGGNVTASGSASLVAPSFIVGILQGVTLSSNVTVQDGGTLGVVDGLTLNHSTLTLAGNLYETYVDFDGTQTLSGTGQVFFGGGNSTNAINSQGSGTQAGAAILTIGPAITVDGSEGGVIEGSSSFDSFINQGTVIAGTAGSLISLSGSFINAGTCSAAGGELQTLGNFWSNTGTLAVSGSGVLNLGGAFTTAGLGTVINTGGTLNLNGSLNNSGATLALGNTTGSLNFTGGAISGGTVTATGSASLFVPPSAYGSAYGVTLGANLTIEDGGAFYVHDGLTLANSTVTIASIQSATELYFQGGAQTLGGAGYLVFGGSNSYNYVTIQGDGTVGGATVLTIGPNITVEGTEGGNFVDTYGFDGLINQGSIIANTAGQTIDITGNFTNDGTASAPVGTLDIDGNNWSNPTGTLALSGSGVLDLGGTITTGSLGAIANTGGTLNLTGLLNNTGSTLALNNFTGPLNLNGGTITGGTITASGSGTLTVQSFDTGILDGVTLAANMTVAPGGELEVLDGLTLDATLTLAGGPVDDSDYGSSLFFLGTQTLGGAGKIALDGEFGFNYVYVEGDGTQAGAATLTIGPNITVDGAEGGIFSDYYTYDSIVNQGTITADTVGDDIVVDGLFTNEGSCSAPAGTLDINGVNWSNNPPGTLAVSGSGVLDIGGTVTTGSLGTISNGGGTLNLTGVLNNTGATLGLSDTTTGTLNLDDGTITGGTVTSTGSAALVVPLNDFATLYGVTLETPLMVQDGAYVTVENGLTLNNATMTMAASNSGAVVYFQGSQTLGGDGQVFFGGNGGYNLLYAQGDGTPTGAATLTIGPQITVDGSESGTIAGYYTVDNINIEGTVNSDGNGHTITISGDTVTNNGLIEATNGGSLSLTNLFNSNTLSITGGGSLSLDGFFLNSGALDDTESTVNFGGSFTLFNLGAFTRVGGSVNITGALDITGSTLALNDATGPWNLDGGAITSGTVTGTSQPWVPGRFGSGLQLGGSVEAFIVPNGLVTANPAITIEVSFKTTADGVLFGFQTFPVDQGGSGWIPAIYIGSDGLLRGEFDINSVTPITSTVRVNDGQWHEASLVGDGTTQSLYLDGNLVGALSGNIDNQGATFNQFGDGYTGGWPATNNGWFPFSGVIDEARIWSVARTAGQIQATANVALTGAEPGLAAYWSLNQTSGSTVPDLSPNGNTGSLLYEDLLQAIGGGNVLNGVTLDTNLTVQNGANLTVENTLTLDNARLSLAAENYSYFGAALYFQGSQTLAGTGELFFGGSTYGNYVYAQGDGTQAGAATLTIGPQITVDGSEGGYIQGYYPLDSIVNQGTINADSPTGQTIYVSGATVTNQGAMEATGGGSLTVNNLVDASGLSVSGGGTLTLLGAWTNSGTITETNSTFDIGGTFTLASLGALSRNGGTVNVIGTLDNIGATLTLSDSTGPWNLDGGTIDGGTVTGTTQLSTDLLQVTGGGILNGVALDTNMTLQDSASLTVRNGLTLNNVRVTLATGNYSASMDFVGTQTLSGLGELFFAPNSYSYIFAQGDGTQAGAATLTIGPQITVDGSGGGDIQGYYTFDSILNQGTINADSPTGQTISLSGASVTNQGTMEATNGGNLTVTNLVDADGLSVSGGGTLTLDGTWANTGLLTAVDSTLTLEGNFTNTGTISETDSTLNLGSGYGGTIIETTGGQFFFANSSTVVHNTDGQATITIQRNFTAPATVDYQTEDGSAVAGTEYTTTQGVLSFQAGQLEQTITVPIIQQDTAPGTSSFNIQLSDASVGSTVGSPGSTDIVILNDAASDFSLSVPTFTLPPLPPPAAASITVNLVPGTSDEQWRLFGELTWRFSGDTAVGLTSGNYEIEFKPVNDYLQPALQVVPLLSGSQVILTGTYISTGAVLTTGSLQVTMAPLATGGWRLQGGTDPTWLPSGQVLTNLNTGDYIVEFEDAPGLVTPESAEIQVQANQLATFATTYLLGDSTAGLAPVLISDTIAQTQSPYVFTGQIQTDEGFGSGFVPLDRVVVTAAHVLFDDGTLSYVQGVRWFFQYEKGFFEAPPQIPVGSYVLEGYAAQRAIDNSPGVASTASRQLDAAALYFLEPAANGGQSGYLASDSASNTWLTGTREKFIAGYPVTGVTPTGSLYATPPVQDPFNYISGSLFSTISITSFPGNSGGPLFVQFDDGNYYPAAIYLGGSAETVVHAIDSEVVDLMNDAEISGNGGANNSGGGINQVSLGATGATAYVDGTLTVTLAPGGAVSAGAYWELAGDNTVRKSGQTVVLAQGAYTVQFFAVGNAFTAPASMKVTVNAGAQTAATGAFIPNPPTITSGSTTTAIEGQAFQYQVIASPAVTQYFTTSTLPSGLTLNGATGLISGVVPSGAPTGTSSIMLSASNAKGLGNLILSLTVALPGELNVTISGKGTVPKAYATPSLQPVGSSISVKATATHGYLFADWTDADTGQVLSTQGVYTFTMPTLLDLQANFVANPFLAAAGSYLSLLEGGTYAESGFAQITIKPTGSFVATFNLGGKSVPVQNTFNNLGQYQGGFILPGGRLFSLNLNLTGTAGEVLTGTVTSQSDGTQIPVNAQLTGPHTNATLAGPYTILLPAASGAGLPGGNGFGAATISRTGSVKFSGKLADGTPVTLAGSLNSNGVWPFLFVKPASSKAGAELLLGSIAFPPPVTGTDGSLEWYRTPDSDSIYPDGFSTVLTLLASRYASPPVNYSPAALTFSGGGLGAPITKTVTLNSGDKVTYTGSGIFTLSFTNPSGLFTGSFQDAQSVRHTFAGTVLQSGTFGLGLFQDASGATGSVMLQKSP